MKFNPNKRRGEVGGRGRTKRLMKKRLAYWAAWLDYWVFETNKVIDGNRMVKVWQ